jgi:hypothetical protein
MSLRLSGTIEPSAVDDRSFTGVASMGKLHESEPINLLMSRGGTTGKDPLVSNFPINNDFEVEFWVLGVTRVDLDRRPTESKSNIKLRGTGNVSLHHEPDETTMRMSRTIYCSRSADT